MSKTIRVILISFCLLILLYSFPFSNVSATGSGNGPDSSIPVSAYSAILVDATNGRVLFSKSSEERLPMASTTKIMTALVALDHGNPEKLIKIPKEAVGVEGSSIYLVEGEELTLTQLLYALLLESANDAAVAIAFGVAGSVQDFADLMNQKATSLGLKNTHFCNPHGLDDEEHYTTAHDLALITAEGLRNETFRTIVSTKKTTIPHAGTQGVRLLINHNKMLRIYEDAIGVKTGFTKKSGRCLVSAAERDGVILVCVTLKASNDWNDHKELLDFGFSVCESVTLCEAESIQFTHPVVGGEIGETLITNPEKARAVLPSNYQGEIRHVIEVYPFLYAPITPGTVVGSAIFYCDTDGDGIEEMIAEVPLTVQIGVDRLVPKFNFWTFLKNLFT